MTSVPVIWLNYNPEAICRGFWDDAMLEDMFSGELWRVPGGVTFEHYDAGVWPDGDFAVVVIPGRHNAHHIDQINHDLNRYRAVLFVFTGDEEATFPWWLLRTATRKVWAMGARPDRHSGVDRPLGSGYSPGFPGLVQSARVTPGRFDLMFCGQDTHARRHDCLDEMRRLEGLNVRGVPTQQFLADGSPEKGGLGRHIYAEHMADTKLAPCPSGPESPDSFRLYEALEAGAVPLADEVTPHGPVPGYWEYVFGGDVPFLVMQDWAALPAVAKFELGRWPGNAVRISAWYQQWKRRMAYALQADIRELTGTEVGFQNADDLITVVIPTCPIPSHPDTSMIEAVVASVREQLPEAEIIIACDGVRPSFLEHQADYDEFLRRLTRLCEGWHNVVPVILDEWGHQAGGTKAALELVTTPLMLFVEHDTPLIGEIDWDGLCEVVASGDVHMVRLLHQTDIHHDHRGMMLDDVPEHGDTLDESGTWHLGEEPRVRVQHFGHRDVPLIRTTQWSQRPHLTTTAFYRERVMPLFGAESCTYIEWKMHSACQNGVEHGMEQQWNKWRICVYAPEGNMERSLHLDGRAGASTDDSVKAFDRMLEAERREAQEAGEREAAELIRRAAAEAAG